MPVAKLRKYLDQNDVRYVVIEHGPAYTAQEIAETAHIPGQELAKTVMISLDGRMAMAVLPASYRVDFDRIREATGAERVGLADEEDFGQLFPDCDLGAMPPFGNVYGIDVYVAESLTKDEEIFFNACSHTQLIRLAYADFERLAKPKVLRFSAGVWT